MRLFIRNSRSAPTLASQSQPVLGVGKVNHRLRARFWRAYSAAVTVVVLALILRGHI